MQDQELGVRRLSWCPACGSANTRVVLAGERANFLCRECGCCWHLEADRFRVVDPRACPGCPGRPVCIRRLWEPLERLTAGGRNEGDALRFDPWC